MKKMVTMLIVLCLLLSSCSNHPNSDSQHVSAIQVKELFDKHAIVLTEPKDLHPENVFIRILNGVKPETYVMNDKQLISIYAYPSEKDAREGAKDFEAKTAVADVVQHRRYVIGNILLFYVVDKENEDSRLELVIENLRSMLR
ncbi:hypothetical protein [Paenibacillus luteus]|uniref:hypothetical protein n=1 Tax=Paenibacillus luteus TaxID=2545753 RepID=UPI001F4F71A6|nr:hypothetical protein [Paenibacillus luteus]